MYIDWCPKDFQMQKTREILRCLHRFTMQFDEYFREIKSQEVAKSPLCTVRYLWQTSRVVEQQLHYVEEETASFHAY